MIKLNAYKGDVYIPVYGSIADAQVYLKEDVDAAIAELKARIADLEKLNHDLCERVTENDDIRLHWEEIEQTRAENEQLKKETEFMHSNCKWYAGDGCARLLGEKLAIIDENVKLKQKLENVQATAYAESVDAGMRERRLKRALYKACANWAMNARMVEIEAEPWGENHESRLWAGVYDKCLKKAEEYK